MGTETTGDIKPTGILGFVDINKFTGRG